jgi:protein associated with RNAse G/E
LAGWYFNLARPFVRTERGIDTLDHQLDVWLEPDGSWMLKDDELLEGEIESGRWTPAEVAAIRAEGAQITADLEAGRRWWSDRWATWRPDQGWAVPELPSGWDS